MSLSRGVVISALVTLCAADATFTHQGCFKDSTPRALGDDVLLMGATGTIEKCAEFCAGYVYFGVQYGHQCYCGNDGAERYGSSTECNLPCQGNSAEVCGGSWAQNVYAFEYTHQGCFADSTPRALDGLFIGMGAATVDTCAEICRGYLYFGVQYASQCFCGNSNFDIYGSSSQCNLPCTGNSGEICGGSYAQNVYAFKHTNVANVQFGAGIFQQTSRQQWVQYSPDERAGLALFWFDELYRSSMGITVRDPVRDIYLRFDLTTNAILYRYEGTEFAHLYDITSVAALDESYAVYKQLAEQYAPIMYLATGEEWFPSSVSFFQTKVHRLTSYDDLVDQGDRYVTNDELSSPSDWDWDGALGKDPTAHVVPTYAFINNADPSGRFFDVVYYALYPFNRGKEFLDTNWGNHVADWENVRVTFMLGDDGVYVPERVVYEAHGDRMGRTWADAEKDGDRPVAYSAYGAHGVYPVAADWNYRTVVGHDLVDKTSQGTHWDTSQSLVTIFKQTQTQPQIAITGVYLSESSTCPDGYERVKQVINLNGDLNQGSGGKDIYLCSIKQQGANPLTGFYLATSSSTCPAGYSIAPKQDSLNGDTNQDAGGKDIYLCVELSTRYEDAIYELLLTESSATPSSAYVSAGLASGLNGDLSQGAGGKTVALHGKRLHTPEWACTGISGAPYAEDCNEWLNFDSEFRWGNDEWYCPPAVGVCRLETGPKGPATGKSLYDPGFVVPTGDAVGFVTDVYLSPSSCPSGFHTIPHTHDLNGDTNQGAGGETINVCVAYSTAPANALRHVFIQESSTCPNGTERAQQHSDLNGDLNEGAGGKDIYMCLARYTPDATCNSLETCAALDSPPIANLYLATFQQCPAGHDPITVASSLNGDLAQGAGGKRIYMCTLPSPVPDFPEHTVTQCDGESKTLTCPTGTLLSVNYGFYGHRGSSSVGVCSTPVLDEFANGCGVDALTYARNLCDDKSACTFNLDNAGLAPFLGDPCPFQHKYFDVGYSCK